MQMQLFVPCPQLQPYVQRISYFESAYGMPANDLRTIVPNGGVKLILPCRSRLHSLIEGHRNDYPELTWWVVGQMEKPAVIESEPGVAMIGIELNAWGAYKFLPVGMKELTDRSVPAAEIWGPSVGELQDKIAYAAVPERKVALLQTFLVQRLERSTRSDPFADYALRFIQARQGLVSIEQLCRDAGCTKQHLDRRFAELVGIRPKQYADIVRFHRFYRMFMNAGGEALSVRDELYEAYYDQSHFIKAFRKYTGLSPREYRKRGNMLGTVFLTYEAAGD